MSLIDKVFTPEIKKKADNIISKYETNRAPLLEVLHLIMEHHGYITLEAEKAVAEYLGLPAIDVREVVTFYTLYYTKPRAKMRFNVCRTLSCSLMGSEKIVQHLEDKLGIKSGQVSEDGSCGIQEVECLGACEIAPMLQFNDDEFVGDLTVEKIDELIEKAK